MRWQTRCAIVFVTTVLITAEARLGYENHFETEAEAHEEVGVGSHHGHRRLEDIGDDFIFPPPPPPCGEVGPGGITDPLAPPRPCYTEFPSTAPTSPPSPSPTRFDVIIVCEDAPREAKFILNPKGKEKGCYWLSQQDEITRNSYCSGGQGILELCPETCGLCSRNCEDDMSTPFEIAGKMKRCRWLNTRRNLWDAACRPGQPAYTICAKLCGSCNDVLQ